MLRFSANLSMLFTELPLLQRFRAARQAGFTAVEIQFPYELSIEQLQAVLQENALKLVLFNVDADTLLQGGEGLSAVPKKQPQFKQAVKQSLAYAEVLQPEFINVLPGRCLNPARLIEYQQTFLENLQYAADAFADVGVSTLFEAVNSHDMPGFIIDNSQKMLSVLAALNHPHLQLQFDIYHMSRMQEDCVALIQQHINKIGHFQFADCPGRGEPGTGEVRFTELFELIDSSAYQGWLGAEYKPVSSTLASLGWLKTYRA